MNISDILSFVGSNSYFFIFLLMIFEGPIVTLVTSFLASLGYFNVFLILFLAILGDLVADIVLFYIGRFGKLSFLAKKYKKKQPQLSKVKTLMLDNPFKALLLIKITAPLAPFGLIFAGTTKMKTLTFVTYATIISLLNKTVYTVLGYFAGVSIIYFFSNTQYAQFILPLIVILIFLVILGINKVKKRIKTNLNSK